MAANHEKTEFNSDHEDWISYTERLMQYYIANGIAEEGDKCRASSYSAPTYVLAYLKFGSSRQAYKQDIFSDSNAGS